MLMPYASMVDGNLELDEDPLSIKLLSLQICPLLITAVPIEEVMIRTWL
jgi:hypothetical protein